MGELNKILAFFIGVFVIILVVGFTISKIRTNNQTVVKGGVLENIFNIKKTTPTPTPTPKAQATKTSLVALNSTKGGSVQKSATEYNENTSTQSIPATGSPLLPLIIVTLPSGLYLLARSRQ